MLPMPELKEALDRLERFWKRSPSGSTSGRGQFVSEKGPCPAHRRGLITAVCTLVMVG